MGVRTHDVLIHKISNLNDCIYILIKTHNLYTSISTSVTEQWRRKALSYFQETTKQKDTTQDRTKLPGSSPVPNPCRDAVNSYEALMKYVQHLKMHISSLASDSIHCSVTEVNIYIYIYIYIWYYTILSSFSLESQI